MKADEAPRYVEPVEAVLTLRDARTGVTIFEFKDPDSVVLMHPGDRVDFHWRYPEEGLTHE